VRRVELLGREVERQRLAGDLGVGERGEADAERLAVDQRQVVPRRRMPPHPDVQRHRRRDLLVDPRLERARRPGHRQHLPVDDGERVHRDAQRQRRGEPDGEGRQHGEPLRPVVVRVERLVGQPGGDADDGAGQDVEAEPHVHPPGERSPERHQPGRADHQADGLGQVIAGVVDLEERLGGEHPDGERPVLGEGDAGGVIVRGREVVDPRAGRPAGSRGARPQPEDLRRAGPGDGRQQAEKEDHGAHGPRILTDGRRPGEGSAHGRPRASW
jgi:hypothetical protein